MKIRIPKRMRGAYNPYVLTINLNDFDVDLFMPSLFFAVLGNGAPYGRRTNQPTEIKNYIEKLKNHPDLENFATPEGGRLLERLVRSDFLILGRKGRFRTQEQILALQPYSLLTGKSGFPTEHSRLRRVDVFLYQALLSAQGGSTHDAAKLLRDHFRRSFGRGVIVTDPPSIDGRYDGQQPLDTMTRMMLAFVDGLASTTVGKQSRTQIQASCPAFAAALGDDMLRYLFRYSDLMPVAAFIYNLKALINLELFIYTLKVVYAINELIEAPQSLPAAMNADFSGGKPDLYLDFTNVRGGLSQAMATYCVRRDIEAYQRFHTTNLLLRQLANYAEQLRRVPSLVTRIEQILQNAKDGPTYLQGLLLLERDPELQRWLETKAADDEYAIRAEYEKPEEEDAADLAAIDAIAADAPTAVQRVVSLLSEAQRAHTLDNMLGWYGFVGGVRKQNGILAGTSNVRMSWRYAPNNDILAVLVQMAAIEKESDGRANSAEARQWSHPQPIRLREFLDYLEQRFGILIDRPPSPYSGAEASAAARENLRAMLDRLRQMGIFSDMSDDFTVQRLQPPYADTRSTNLLSQRS